MNRTSYCSFLVTAAFVLSTRTASGAVANTTDKWPADSNGRVPINVCIIKDSSAEQYGSGGYYGFRHDPNPNLDEVLRRVRTVLKETWSRYSAVEFLDWRQCDTIGDTSGYVGLYIHSKAENKASVGVHAKGLTTVENPGVQFKPFGNFSQCITYNGSTTKMQYSFDCVEQYAIHEFGHVIGMQHEWRHPSAPATCAERPKDGEAILTWTQASNGYFVTPGYDRKSIMVYGTDCADVEGVRFGNTRLSAKDIRAVNYLYSTPHWLLTRRAALQTSLGYYLSAVNGGGNNLISTTPRSISAWEEFDFVPLLDTANVHGLRTTYGTYLGAVNHGGHFGPNPIDTDSAWLDSWERFGVIRLGGDTVALRTANGINYVSAEANGGIPPLFAVSTLRTSVGPTETFTLRYRPAGRLVHNRSTGAVSVVYQGQLRWIPDGDTLIALGFSWDELTIDSALVEFPDGDSYPSLRSNLVHDPSTHKVYLLQQGVKRHIPDENTFIRMGFSWSAIRDLASPDLDRIPEGPPMPQL